MVFIKDISPLVINLPIIITLIASTRYIIGFKTWKNYTTIVLALSFLFLEQYTNNILLSIGYWVALLFIIIGGATLVKYLIRKYSFNFYGRYAIIYTGATILFMIAAFVFSFITKIDILTNSSFVIAAFLIGSTIDDLATLQFKKDLAEYGRRLGTSVVLSFISGLLITWPWWNQLVVQHQEIILITLLIAGLAAVWNRLRLTEFFRFNALIKN